jgi:hypothetical protein
MAIAQNGWTFCFKCQGLFFADTSSRSICPKDKQPHDGSRSGPYSVEFSDSTVPGQNHWKRCSRCQGLYFGGNNSPTFCPAHNPSDPNDLPGHSDGGNDFTLNYYQLSRSRAAGQTGWRWCSQCQGLFFADGGLGSCPIRPGASHAFDANNFNYAVKWEHPLADSTLAQRLKLLIVTPQEFQAALQPLVAHKDAHGMKSVMVTTEGLSGACDGIDAPERIKRGIWQAFVKLNIKYVLLVGDASKFPVRYRFEAQPPSAQVGGQSGWMDGSYNPTDLYYANLTRAGNQAAAEFDDWDADGDGKYNVSTWNVNPYTSPNQNPDNVTGYPDVALGRLPANSAAEVTRYVNKVIRYETGQMTGPKEITFLEDVAYDNPPSLSLGLVHASGIVGNVNYVALEYGNPPPGHPWTAGTPASIDSAVTRSWWISYIGHGENLKWGYSVDLCDSTHVFSGLTNKFNLPIVFSAACSTGAFALTAPIGEYIADDGKHWFWFYPDTKKLIDQGVTPNRSWDFSQPRPPIPIPPPRALDFESGALRTFAHAWLFNANEGGGIAFFGENEVMEDGNSTELEGYVLNEYYVKGTLILGDIWLSAQRRYYDKYLATSGDLDPNFTPPRIYLGIMELFGDPSLSLLDSGPLPPPPGSLSFGVSAGAKNPSLEAVEWLGCAGVAHSDDRDRRFQLIATSCSDRSRPGCGGV